MTYKHITVSLPPVPMGDNFSEPFKQSPEAQREYNIACAAPEMLAALEAASASLQDTSDGKWNSSQAFYALQTVRSAIAKATV